MSVARGVGGGNDWWSFRVGAQLLVGHGHVLVSMAHGQPHYAHVAGLHVYAAYPMAQIGPLSLFITRLALLAGSAGPWLFSLICAVLFVPTFAFVERTAAVARLTRTTAHSRAGRVRQPSLTRLPSSRHDLHRPRVDWP